MSKRKYAGVAMALALFVLPFTGGSAFADELTASTEDVAAVETAASVEEAPIIDTPEPAPVPVVEEEPVVIDTPAVPEPPVSEPAPVPVVEEEPVASEPEPAAPPAPEPAAPVEEAVVEEAVEPAPAPVVEEEPATSVPEPAAPPAPEPAAPAKEAVVEEAAEQPAASESAKTPAVEEAPVAPESTVSTDPVNPPEPGDICDVEVQVPVPPDVNQTGNTVTVPDFSHPGMLWSDKFGGDIAPGTVFTITVDFPNRWVVARLMEYPIQYCWEDKTTADKEWALVYNPDFALIDTVPSGPDRRGNVISDPGDEGLVYSDRDGNVLTETTLTPGQTICYKVEAEEGYRIPNEMQYINGWCLSYTEQPEVPPTFVAPVEPSRIGNTLVLLPQPYQYYTISNDEVIGSVEVLPVYTAEKPLLICTNLVESDTLDLQFPPGAKTCWPFKYEAEVIIVPTDPPVTPVDPAPQPDPVIPPIVEPMPSTPPVVDTVTKPTKVDVKVVVPIKHDKRSGTSNHDSLPETGAAEIVPLGLSVVFMIAVGVAFVARRRRSNQL